MSFDIPLEFDQDLEAAVVESEPSPNKRAEVADTRDEQTRDTGFISHIGSIARSLVRRVLGPIASSKRVEQLDAPRHLLWISALSNMVGLTGGPYYDLEGFAYDLAYPSAQS